MRELIDGALEAARLAGATYADARVVDTLREKTVVGNGRVEAVENHASFGIGVRVIADGAWGFASTREVTAEAAARTAKQAVAIAKASAMVAAPPVRLSELTPQSGVWSGTCAIDPFAIPLEDKLALLHAADAAMRAVDGVSITKSKLSFARYRTWFGSLDGSFIEQTWTEAGAGIDAWVLGDDEVLARSYPNSHGGGWRQAGWEYVESLDLLAHAPRIAEECAALRSAAPCPSTTTDLIIDGGQLGLQVHESIGHPLELDRVLGDEAAFAGTSWVKLDDLGTLTYGSPIVDVTADATVPGSLGSFGWDDEGVPAQRDYLITAGKLTGFLSSRESAAAIGRTSNGATRADGYNRTPLVRMTTVSLEPGEWSFDDLIQSTEDGMYIETNDSWSIDDRRLNFQFGCQIGWEIKDGELGRMIKKPNYTGITPQFWGSCDAICNRDHWEVWGLANCGKGEPMQVARVAHGAAPARFRGVQVGVGR